MATIRARKQADGLSLYRHRPATPRQGGSPLREQDLYASCGGRQLGQSAGSRARRSCKPVAAELQAPNSCELASRRREKD